MCMISCLEDELMALRLVMTNEDALALFVPKSGGFAALAMSPDDGFIRDGAPAKSAVALADLPDAGTAAAEAAKACDGLRKGKCPLRGGAGDRAGVNLHPGGDNSPRCQARAL